MLKSVGLSKANALKVGSLISNFRATLFVCLLLGMLAHHNAGEAQTTINYSPPATIIKIGVFPSGNGTWTEGFGFMQLSVPVPAACPNPWWYMPINNLAGSRTLNATAQVAFQTQSRIESLAWHLDQGLCVVNFFILVP
jgi:hypothetical protein